MKFAGPLLVLLCLGACAPRPQTSSHGVGIIGGEAIEPRSAIARHVVALAGQHNGDQYLCTAVLIAKDAVLTAGHCGEELEQGKLIFSTDLSTSNTREMRTIASVSIHPDYAQTVEKLKVLPSSSRGPKNWGDVAVVRFAGRLPAGYSPVELAWDEALENGESVVLAGYGLTDGDAEEPAKQLNAVRVEIKNAKFSKTEFSIDQSQGKGACHGDSGGPAFSVNGRELKLIGITSRGSDKHCRRTAIYTRVSAVQDWLSGLL